MENGSNWKQKLSASQLERKRRVDRTNQRKSRLNNKRALEDYRQRFIELVDKDTCGLLRRLVAENMRLHEIHTQYQSKMESMTLLSKECLESGSGPFLDLSPPSPAREKQASCEVWTSPCPTDGDSGSNGAVSRAQLGVLAPICKQSRPSILFQVAAMMRNQWPESSAECPINDLVEAIMVWKLDQFQSLGSEFLITYLGLDKAPVCVTAEKTRHTIAAPDFYHVLLNSLRTGERIHTPQSGVEPEDALLQMPVMAQQRRLIAYYVCVLIQEYRTFFKGEAELFSQFWLLYTLFTFLTFPTEDNLKKAPSWLWPTNSQFEYDHLASIDFLPWPKLRSGLAQIWQQYDIDALVTTMVESFELADFPGKHCAIPIRVAQDTLDLELDPDFETGILNLQNYSLNSKFNARYPDLAVHIA